MEQEKTYKQIISKIESFNHQLENLENESSAKLKSEALNDIETHFVSLFCALEQRKQQLILSVDKLFQDSIDKRESEKKKLKDKIEITNKLLDYGKSMYDFQHTIAVTIWESAQEVRNTESKIVKVDLPLSLLEAIHVHGKATSVQFKALDVSTIVGRDNEDNENTENENREKENKEKENIKHPFGIVFNPIDDCLYFCDHSNNTIKKVTKSGKVSNFVKLSLPVDIAFNLKQQCFYVSSYNCIRKVTMTGEKSVFAGGKEKGYKDGEREEAVFDSPWGVAVNEDTGDVYVADSKNNIIRKITPQGQVSTFAGIQEKKGHSNGDALSSLFNYPAAMCFHSHQQALFVCDRDNSRIRKISLSGQVSTVCKFQSECIAIVDDNTFLLSSMNSQILKLSIENNKVETEVFAGTQQTGYKDGTPKESQFKFPRGIAIDHTTNTCFVVDHNNHKIRAIKYQ